jgi:polysaccharide chain length determinant protein (PEP-CTERM system associated)
MALSGPVAHGNRHTKPAHAGVELSLEHYWRLILHRKWLVLGTFIVVSLSTAIVAHRLPDVYSSETLILVDPQKVPESYVKPTVTGDVRDRLGTLSQQILSATRLQKIIDTFNLYANERKTLPREDVILLMRSHIRVNVLSDFGGSQDLQAFRISFTGSDPRLVAQVTNELASLFIEENLKAREQQAQGTSDFLQNQLQETRKLLEQQEAKLKDFKLKHIGEMPEQQAADIQILGQMQAQLQAESDALSRAQQQKSYVQSMMAQTSAPVVDLDGSEPGAKSHGNTDGPKTQSALSIAKAKLAQLRTHYSDSYPDVQKLKRQIEEEEKAQKAELEAIAKDTPPEPPVKASERPPVNHSNPVLQSQLEALDAEIVKHKAEQARLSNVIAGYQSKLEAIPVREQQINDLVRDYEISKAHYSQLLEKQLSAETATQLEIRQKGEKFSILDPAQPAERPSQPNRRLINAAGSLGGLALGLVLALITEVFGMSITAPEQIVEVSGLPVLEVIPMIHTQAAPALTRKRLILTAVSGAALVLVCCALYYYHSHWL